MVRAIYDVDTSKKPVNLYPLQMGAMPFGRLGELIGSAVDRGDEVIDAVDLLISRAHG